MNSTDRRKKVFLSRTTAGLKSTAEKVASILRGRGMEVIIQTEFLPSWRDVKGMLVDKLIECDAVISLIGHAHGMEMRDPVTGLKDKRTEGRVFSYTQLEFLVARDLGRPVFAFFLSGDELIAPYPAESADLAQRQRNFIQEFAQDGTNTYGSVTTWASLEDIVRRIDIPLSALASKPANLPFSSLGSLFKGREEFLGELRAHLLSKSAAVIKGHRVIHGMGGVGKTRAAIEYAWRHAEDYSALLFVSSDSPEALQRNLAALCDPLVLNLPEQSEKDQNLRVEAALKWLRLHPGWFLIIDNVDSDEAAKETTALLQKLSAGHVVITSRLSDWTGQVTALDLDVLSEAASIAFLDERTEERRAKQPEDPAQVATLVRLLDCLALALEQAGALISHQRISYTDYLALWETSRPVALAWHDEETMKYPRSLAITYETSVAQLSASAKEFFRVLSWLAPDPLPRDTLEALPNPAEERVHLNELDHLHLVRFQQNGKAFSVHRLVQEITRQQQPAPPPPALRTALTWMDSVFLGEPSDVRTWPTLDPLAPHARAVAFYAADGDISDPTTRLLNQVALLYSTKAMHQAAEPLMRRALAIDEQFHGVEHPEVAIDLNNLAQLLQDTNRLAEAEPLMCRALAISEQSHGAEHPKVAISLNFMATLLHATNRLAEAEPLMRRALAIDEQSYGTEHPNIATDLNNLAQLLQATNRLTEAEPLMRRALAIDEQSYGVEHPRVATDLNNLAQLLKATNRLAEAEPLMRRALEIDEQSYGAEHPRVAMNLNNLALLLQDTNRLTEVEPLLRRALAIDEQAYGAEHPKVAIRLNNLALLLQDTNRLGEAEPLMRRALAIDEQSHGVEHPRVAIDLNNLALLLKATNRLPEAEPLMRRALEIDEQSYGAEHPRVATDLNNLALLFKATNRLAEAEPLMRRALEIDEQSYGVEHPDVSIDLNNLALLLKDTNRLAEAEPLMRRALAIDEESYGAKHPRVANCLSNLALLLQDTNRLAEAEALMLQALAISEQSYGAEHPRVANFLNNLAQLLKATNRLPEAEPLMLQALAISEQSYEAEHPNVGIRLNNLASLLKAANRLAEAEPVMRRALIIFAKFTATTGHEHPHLQAALGNYHALLTESGLSEAQAAKSVRSARAEGGL